MTDTRINDTQYRRSLPYDTCAYRLEFAQQKAQELRESGKYETVTVRTARREGAAKFGRIYVTIIQNYPRGITQ